MMDQNKSVRRDLRKNATLEEQLLWDELRNNKLGVKFRRQYSMGKYVVDYYCAKAKLVLEIDGSPHKDELRKNMDNLRDTYMESSGVRVLRFWGNQVRKDMDLVLEVIKSKLPRR